MVVDGISDYVVKAQQTAVYWACCCLRFSLWCYVIKKTSIMASSTAATNVPFNVIRPFSSGTLFVGSAEYASIEAAVSWIFLKIHGTVYCIREIIFFQLKNKLPACTCSLIPFFCEINQVIFQAQIPIHRLSYFIYT